MPSRLKSLELQGYKTFANKTLFAFSDTVTAIVGPNGSGKSNIADSLRWVLGEQAYSLLRARKTEDMIFSGSESRPRAGMASATITFDNSDGWLPIDFSEVAITRRAYRDGDNEYLINGQRVRLRDVSELLAQSGLAERTYTVIGQGLVDAALSLKAEERRRLFEEAAGIGLHRTRREEALRRLETTRRNLERVEDILAELRPRLTSLERQSRRAREYEQVKADLRILLRDWYGFHWHDSQRQLAQAQAAARAQEDRLEEGRQEQMAAAERLAELRQRLQTLRADLGAWHKQLAQIHAQRQSASRDLAVCEERNRAVIEQHQTTDQQLVALEQEASLNQAQIESVAQEIDRLKVELDEQQAQAAQAEQALQSRQSERAQAEGRIRELRQEVGNLSARQGQLQGMIAERQAQIERAHQAVENARQAVAKLEVEKQKAQARLRSAQGVEQAAAERHASAEQAALEQRRRMQSVEQARQLAQDERAALSTERSRWQAQLSVLEQAAAAMTGYASGTKALLQAARKGQLAGVLGALNEFVQAPAEFEAAIAAALGEAIDAVLLETDPEAALDTLQAGKGRGMLLPLVGLRATGRLSLPADREGFLGIAAELARIETTLDGRSPGANADKILQALLGQTLVVRDRDTAKRVLVDQPAGVRAVTLVGEVFHASGAVQTFGAAEGEAAQTMVTRTRQRREIAVRLEELQAQWQTVEQKLAGLDEELKTLKTDGNRLQAEVQAAQRSWEEARRASDQAGLALEQVERQLTWQTTQTAEQQAILTRSQSEAESQASELEKIVQSLEQKREMLRQATQAAEALVLDEFQSEAAHWKMRAAVSERALSDARRRWEERQAVFKKLEENRQALQARLQELQTLSQNLERERVELRQAEGQIAAQTAAAQAEIEPAEASLAQLEEEQALAEKADAEERQALAILERYYSQARIHFDRRQEALLSLRRRIEEDFGLVAFEYAEQVSGPTPLPFDGMVEQLPLIKRLAPDLDEAIKRQRAQLRRIGPINPEAQVEYNEVKQRYEFMTEQVADLHQADQDVRQVIAELDHVMETEFKKVFIAVASEFKDIFTRLFGGGSARLILTDADNLSISGIDIEARLPGRRSQGLSLLSGGERSLTAVALIFALLRVSPTPFCVLDEVDAMLDEMNVGRFRDLLRELSDNTQFVIVTHNRNTVQVANVIYGVTMGRDSSSQILSLKLDQVSEIVD